MSGTESKRYEGNTVERVPTCDLELRLLEPARSVPDA